MAQAVLPNPRSAVDFWSHEGIAIFIAVVVLFVVGSLLVKRWPIILELTKQVGWFLASAAVFSGAFVMLIVSLATPETEVNTIFGGIFVIGGLISIVRWVYYTEEYWYKPDPVEPYAPTPLLREFKVQIREDQTVTSEREDIQ